MNEAGVLIYWEPWINALTKWHLLPIPDRRSYLHARALRVFEFYCISSARYHEGYRYAPAMVSMIICIVLPFL